jgi:hypothetical protein
MTHTGEVLYTNEQLDNDINTVVEIANRLKNIVWCEQTPEFNFDKLSKTEQLQFIGLYKDAGMLENSLKMYKNWFRKNGYGK